MDITYLAQHPHECEKIARWYFDEWGYTVPNITIDRVLEKVTQKAQNVEAFPLALVAHDDQQLVAVAELKIREHVDYPEYEHWLGGVYVAEQGRGKGYAAALIEKAKQHVRQLGIERLYLQCEQHNIDLYKKYGFTILHNAIHNGVETQIMVWLVSDD
ncbi:GNAT family N-acetyltransferase [Vibrio paucivorans]